MPSLVEASYSESSSEKRIIALVGFMAAGKTTLGQRLAQRMGWRFVDLDKTGVQLSGRSIPKLFDLYGEPGFRAIERLALMRVLQQQGPVVLATGGGTYIQPRCRAWLNQHATVVSLQPGWPIIRMRLMMQQQTRPLGLKAESAENQQYVYQRYRFRQKNYRRAAHCTRGCSPDPKRLAVQLGARR